MALPADFNTIVIKGTYMDFLGSAPASGTITITPNASHIKHLASDTIIVSGPRTANLNPDGTFTLEVPITNDVDVLPSFQYDVQEQIQLAGGLAQRRYSVEVPQALLPGPVDMADLVAVGTVPQGTTALTKAVADTLYEPKGSGSGEGGDGVDGKTPELRNNGTYIQWRYVGDVAWIDLVALSTITGPQGIQGVQGTQGIQGVQGTAGTNGKNVEMQTSATHVQWRLVGDATWIDLVTLESLRGPQGLPGNDGADADPADITAAVDAKFMIDADSVEEAAAPDGTIFLQTVTP
jgi:hypothetical protein